MLSTKQGSSTYHSKSLWYDSAGGLNHQPPRLRAEALTITPPRLVQQLKGTNVFARVLVSFEIYLELVFLNHLVFELDQRYQ